GDAVHAAAADPSLAAAAGTGLIVVAEDPAGAVAFPERAGFGAGAFWQLKLGHGLSSQQSLRRRRHGTGGFDRPAPVTVGFGLAAEVGELGVLLEEGQLGRADRTVAVLGDDHLGDAGVLGVRVVVLVA